MFRPVLRSATVGRVGLVLPRATYIVPTKQRKTLKVYGPLPTAHGERSGQLMNEIKQELFQRYDPTGAKRNLIYGGDPLRAGDIVRVVFKDPLKNPSFTGYLVAIDRNGPDLSILLRATVTQIGLEQRFSIFNPFIERIDRVRKPQKYSGRRRHFYIRGTKRDAGDYEGKK